MTDKRQKNKILALFSALSLLMGVVCNMTIPVFASGASVPSEDTYRVSFQSDQLTFRTERTTYTIADANESNLIKIPLYFWYSSSAADNTYMSGWVIMAQTRFLNFKFNTGSVTPSYFEAYNGGSYYCSSPASDYRFTVYFDNHIAANNTPHLLGYYVFDVSAYTSIQIDVTSGTTNVGIASSGVFGSTGQYGLVQSIIDGLDNSVDIDTIIVALQNIDTIDLESIISGISSNTSLLTQIYQRLGQIQTADNQFYSNIDDIIDTISWNNVSSTFDSSGNSFDNLNTSLNNANPLYMKFSTGTFYGLLHLRVSIRSQSTGTRNSFRPIFIGRDITNNLINESEIYIFSISSSYIDIYINNFIYGDLYIGLKNEFNKNINVLSYTLSRSEYINSSDIEYWTILNSLRSYKIMNLLDSYLNANVSEPVDSAATQAAGLAQNQAAAEQSLAALSPADMGDFDSAVSDITILDDVSNSLVFWTNAVHAFSTRSGSLWGVFIFGLLIGLIAFILRLRR